LNIGLAASGRPPAIKLRKNVLAETAEAAYSEYVSTRKLIHCWKIMLKPAPMKAAATTQDGHGIDGSAVQPNQNRPIVKRTPPMLIGSNLASGTCGKTMLACFLVSGVAWHVTYWSSVVGVNSTSIPRLVGQVDQDSK
jgi:hypothetical protein